MLKGRENLIKFGLFLTILFGLFLIVAWGSYSPLDNAWSVASSATENVLNKTGFIGAWLTDLLLAMFGKIAVVVPFGLTFTAAYLLLLRLSDGLNGRQVMLWLLSFSLFVAGLAGLASVLLSNSPYYLSGGFVGGLLNSAIDSTLGQFGVLFVAMVLTSVGFYFCSGQIVWQLFNRLYKWIFESKPRDENVEQSPQEKPALQKNEENSPLVEPVVRESQSEVQGHQEALPTETAAMTDLSRFSRPMPNITGLKTQVVAEPVVEQASGQEHTNSDIEQAVELPKINMESVFEPSSLVEKPVATDNLFVDETVFEKPSMPTVRLNSIEVEQPTVRTPTTVPVVDELPEIKVNEPEFVADIEKEEPPVLAEPEIEKPAFMQPTPKVSVKPLETSPDTEPKSEQKTVYPNGYGESLIHPLLRKTTKVEKPTTPLPTLDLLTVQPPQAQQVTEQDILETSERIEQELANFGVKATVEDVLIGPVVTRYEIKPAAGVKASKITNLDSDLARALIFQAIRITDVVPGKPYMGIETPNKQRETVWLRDVLDSDAFRYSKATLPMALGKDISGQPVVVDMAKMPHLLVAGQTGGGKSVGVNTMILSLLYKLTPEQVRFIMIDPKVVELSIYNDIPHLLTPVVTDMKKAENALRWAVEEMERRYLLVSSLTVRNIEGYNDKIRQAEEMGIPIPNPLWRPGDTMDALPPPLEKLSYIVLIVDEFADLMMSAGKQVEDHIMRIAQKARAVGIHLILATQRPSTDVITGVIKANIPSRIAFTVASQIDSRTILDKGGAESLLGRGDMLYSGAGSPEIIRVHGAFMTDDDVQRVADNWRARGKPDYINSIVESADDDEMGSGKERGLGNDLDPLFDEITQYVIDSGVTSISGIQRRFSLGFNRAARIIDQMEEQGIVSSQDSRGKREVLAR